MVTGDAKTCAWWEVPSSGEPTVLLPSGPCPDDFDVAPDGTIALVQGGHLVIRKAGEPDRILRDLGVTRGDLTWAPDASAVLYSDANGLHVLRIADGVELARMRTPAAAWLDSTHVLFVRSLDLERSELWLLSTATAAEEHVTSFAGVVSVLSVASDGILMFMSETTARIVVATTATDGADADMLPALDTGASLDVLPVAWTATGEVVSFGTMKTGRGFVQTPPRGHGVMLWAEPMASMGQRSVSAGHVFYAACTNECVEHDFDLAQRADRTYRTVDETATMICAREVPRCIRQGTAGGARFFDPRTHAEAEPAPAIKWGFALSPDGRELAHVQDGRIVIQDLATHAETTIVPAVPLTGVQHEVAWPSPGDKLLVTSVERGANKVSQVARDGSSRVIASSKTRVLSFPVSSASGDEIAFAAMHHRSSIVYLPYQRAD